MRRAIYPGSFDPLTNGHVNVIERSLRLCDRLIVAVARNISKTALFSVDERIEMVREVFADEPRLEVHAFEGLLVDYAQSVGAHVIMRGLRAVADFEYEYQMANMNRTLAPGVETAFIMADPANFYVSSRLVKEVASLGGDIAHAVPPTVFARLAQRLPTRQAAP
ncbi:MAG: pantetheine-phosphate adenylyltransferase [Myxococcales bacterium]|nr:pantetheine-phosphate adenylyltransferase [Myxococcales bacterium]MCB9533451.1 pantetheine-phosphate adenylyltransferase [Myxococcales bacterium]